MPALKPVRGWAARTDSRWWVAERVEVQAEDVVLDAERDQPHLRPHVVRDLGRRVQCDRLPHGHHLLLGQAVALEEQARGVGPVDLETLVRGAVTFEQADVVEHRADVEQFGVVVEAELLSLQRRPQEHAPRVVEQQRRRRLADELGRLAGERTVWDRNARDPGRTPLM